MNQAPKLSQNPQNCVLSWSTQW